MKIMKIMKHITFQKTCVKKHLMSQPNSKITLPLLSSCLIWNDPSHLHHEKTLDFPQIKPITSHCITSHRRLNLLERSLFP